MTAASTFSPDGQRILTASDDQTAKIWRAARPEDVAAWKQEEKIRLIGVRASKLERGVFQRNLLEAKSHSKLDRAMEAADKLRAKFGFQSVQLARSLEPADPGLPGKPQKEVKKRRFLGRE